MTKDAKDRVGFILSWGRGCTRGNCLAILSELEHSLLEGDTWDPRS